MCGMVEHPESELPAGDDVIIWHLQERDGLDVYLHPCRKRTELDR